MEGEYCTILQKAYANIGAKHEGCSIPVEFSLNVNVFRWESLYAYSRKIRPVAGASRLRLLQLGRRELSPNEHLCVAQTWLLSNVRLANT